MKAVKNNVALDITAMALSAACLVHCLAMPLLMVLLPIVSMSIIADERVHPVLLAVALPTSLIALLQGCRKHRRRYLLIPGLSGLGLITFAISGLDENQERFMTVTGVLLVALAHSLNWRLLRGSGSLLAGDKD
jgi:hypothetical protein